MFQTPWRIALQRHDENVGATPLLENQTHRQIKGMSSNHFGNKLTNSLFLLSYEKKSFFPGQFF